MSGREGIEGRKEWFDDDGERAAAAGGRPGVSPEAVNTQGWGRRERMRGKEEWLGFLRMNKVSIYIYNL